MTHLMKLPPPVLPTQSCSREKRYHQRLLIVGNPGTVHVGAHLLAAAKSLGLETTFVDLGQSWSSNRWLNRIAYRFAGRRPTRLRAFGQEVRDAVDRFHPNFMLVTGISAPDAATLRAVRERRVQTANFLTDDPWNPNNGAGFFWAALREYDVIYSPRRSNMGDLHRHGCQRVEYLPFGYNPEVHRPERPATAAERARFECDVAIIGGADADRAPLALALLAAGLNLKLYGGYWDRWPALRPYWGGFVYGRELRLAVGGAVVNISMGRRQNRDGHAMRSLELPAMGACLVVEDTPEHRELFGDEQNCVAYYRTPEEMVVKVKFLCAQRDHARTLGVRVFKRICREARHTYADRLGQILDDMVESA